MMAMPAASTHAPLLLLLKQALDGPQHGDAWLGIPLVGGLVRGLPAAEIVGDPPPALLLPSRYGASRSPPAEWQSSSCRRIFDAALDASQLFTSTEDIKQLHVGLEVFLRAWGAVPGC